MAYLLFEFGMIRPKADFFELIEQFLLMSSSPCRGRPLLGLHPLLSE